MLKRWQQRHINRRAARYQVINIIRAPVKAVMRPDGHVIVRSCLCDQGWSMLFISQSRVIFHHHPPSQSSGTLTGSMPDPPSVVRTSSRRWVWFTRCSLVMPCDTLVCSETLLKHTSASVSMQLENLWLLYNLINFIFYVFIHLQ